MFSGERVIALDHDRRRRGRDDRRLGSLGSSPRTTQRVAGDERDCDRGRIAKQRGNDAPLWRRCGRHETRARFDRLRGRVPLGGIIRQSAGVKNRRRGLQAGKLVGAGATLTCVELRLAMQHGRKLARDVVGENLSELRTIHGRHLIHERAPSGRAGPLERASSESSRSERKSPAQSRSARTSGRRKTWP
jgi:hypothetical protein